MRRNGKSKAGAVNRREFLASTVATSLLPALAAGQEAARRPARAAAPGWMDDWPVVMVGNWDDAPIFPRRVGGLPVWLDEDYRREHTEETVQALQQVGVTMAILHFFKGFGLEAERPYIEDTQRLAALCHAHGIKVGVYVGSTIVYETFLLEEPSAEEWFVPDFLGRPVIYDGQTFRQRVYFMHPGYRDYIQRVLRIAVEDVKADLIHFDNTSMQGAPPIFLHPLAVEEFRGYLRSRYTAAELGRRFGFRDPKYVHPPKCDWPLGAINDPLFQDWTAFRCQTLGRYYQEMAAFIHSLNPAVAVECNPSSGMNGFNTCWFQGVDYPRILANTQAVWTEEGNDARVTPDGILISKIRTYIAATGLGNHVFTYTGVRYGGAPVTEAQMKLEMAEAMAYNRQCLGMAGGILSVQELAARPRRYIEFFRKNCHLFRGVQSAAEVAVLHSFASLAFNNNLPYQSTWLFEEALIQSKIPFDIIFDLQELARYRVLVLADQECLSHAECDAIRRFVRLGGGLIATEWTSLFTEQRELRRDFELADLFGVHAPARELASGGPAPASPSAARHRAGQGRVAYIPEVRPAISKPPDGPMASRYWKLPLNADELVDAARWAGGGEVGVRVKAPSAVTVNLLAQQARNAFLLHLINYDAERTPAIKNVEVSVRLPGGQKRRRARLYSPDASEATVLATAARNGRLEFVLPALETYALVELA
jgi:hypothetical protein